MSKILITGGAGFLGYHLARHLALSADNHIVIVNRSIPSPKDREFGELLALPNVEIRKADLTLRTAWKKVGTGYDYVYHLVSIKGFKNFNEMPEEVLRVGIVSAMNALDWFRSENKKAGAKILYTSSNEVYTGGLVAYGKMQNPAPETVPAVIPDLYDPRWSYAGQKIAGELLFIHYAKAYGFRMSIVRPTNLYGPRAGKDGMIPKIIRQANKRADPFTIFGPDDTRTFCYIEDAVEALAKIMESGRTDGQTYNIGDDKQTSVREVTETIFDAVKWRPKKIVYENSPREAVRNSAPDISKIKKDIGWVPKTSLKKGMAKTVEWYMKHPQS